MAMYEEYFKAYTSYIAKYGKQTFLLYRSVLFLKYMPKNLTNSSKTLRRFAEICDLVVAEKKSINGRIS